MSSDAVDDERPTHAATWRRRAIVAALFSAGASVAIAFAAACAYFIDSNLLPHRP